eukprot:TCALIF_03669-PA protein Name:"Similar to GALE UDP-glucose 4-epimerase (Pongo abelii)" AED:0.18 eAED:0.18 QI:465/0.66/0.8/0.9/0.88/0.9/10/0/383
MAPQVPSENDCIMSGTGKTIFVTGGGGYVASHCIVGLLEEDFNVIAVDNFVNCIKDQSGTADINGQGSLMPESLVRVQKLTGKSLTFYEADLCNIDSLRSVFTKHKIDGVIHFAALKAVGESCALPLKYYGNNVMGSSNLMEVMMEFGVKKIVFSSSATVYGSPEYLPLDEKHPTGKCTNPYGKTKFFMEEIMKDVCAANNDWGCMLLRYFNPVGAHPSGDIGEDPQGVPNNLMPYIAQVAVGRREKLMVYGHDYDTPDGTGVRDYIHVMDIADGHVAAARALVHPEFLGVKIYNLGTGKGASVLDVVKAFEEASGQKVPYELCPRRAGDVGSSYATCELVYKELGWKAKLSLYDMLLHMRLCYLGKDMWTWQSKNAKGYRKD